MRGPTVLLAALLVGCATAPTRSTFMEEKGIEVTSDALRMRLRAQASSFTGVVEQSADAAAAASADPAVRRRTLVWKIGVAPALYQTLFDQRPIVGLVDTWALLVQAEAFLAGPEGRAAFGPGAVGMLDATRDLQGRVREIARWAVDGRDLDPVEARIRAWAARHPASVSFSTRESIRDQLATILPAQAAGAIAIAAGVGESLDGLVSRVDFLPVLVPRQATWQAELAYVDLVDPRVDVVVRRAEEAIGKLDRVIGWLGGPGLDGFADRQREAVFLALDGERRAVEQSLAGERTALFDYVTKERTAVLEQLRSERVAAMEDLRRTGDQIARDAAARATEVVDHALQRLALLLGSFAAVLLAIAWWVRRRPRAPSAQG